MGIRRAVIERLFKVKTINGAFSDARKGSYASAAALTFAGQRKGQLVVATQAGAIDAIYVCTSAATTKTGTAAWTELPSG